EDVYWAQEGRASIDAVFVAVAVVGLFLLGLRPIGFDGAFDLYQQDGDVTELIVEIVLLALLLAAAVLTLLKGKLWTGLVGLFLPPLLLVGAIRMSRPGAPWARWRYAAKPDKLDRAVQREQRYREPIVRWKILLQEAVAGRFGVTPDVPAPQPPVLHAESKPGLSARLAAAVRWHRTRRRLRRVTFWRLPVTLVAVAFLAALLLTDDDVIDPHSDSGTLLAGIDVGSTATLLSVIAGGMVTLAGLVFTALTLAMQTGAAQLSVRVVPMLQQAPVMRWSIGTFLATFAFSLVIALDLAVSGATAVPIGSAGIAMMLALVSTIMFIAVVTKVAAILNPSRLLHWISGEGRIAILRAYPAVDDTPTLAEAPVTTPEPTAVTSAATTTITLRHANVSGRVLLAVNLEKIQRLAHRWGVEVSIEPSIGEFVAIGSPLFVVGGPQLRVRTDVLLRCLVFGDTSSPGVSPSAALQSIVDIALKALSPAINDPSRAVQSFDYLEDLLVMLAPRVRAEIAQSPVSRIRGHQVSWADYVGIATDEVRHFSHASVLVQRRLRALLTRLVSVCPADQHPPLLDRLKAMDAAVALQWPDAFDAALARVADPQGLSALEGTSTRIYPLVVTPHRPSTPQ
ncbi:MAG: DUF2254 family protein, partial [Mycobacteriaceae bacterium]